MSQTDQLRKFMFSAAPVRGELVILTDTWQEVLRRRQASQPYPEPVRRILGEMMSAAALLSANLKFNGALIMQVHGDGPVQMLVVECNADLTMRATAKLAADVVIADDAQLSDLINRHGDGRFAITLDPQDKLPGHQAYQGVVPLHDGHVPLQSMTAILEHYMLKSEQLDTRIWLAADDRRSAGLLLQRLPGEGGKAQTTSHDEDLDAWDRLSQLSATITREELLDLDGDTILRRLYLEESELHGVRLLDPRPVHFACSCSRSRVGNMLKMLGAEEVDGILAERGKVDIHCDFCGQHYAFDPVDCAQLFASDTLSSGIRPASGHH